MYSNCYVIANVHEIPAILQIATNADNLPGYRCINYAKEQENVI